MNLFYRTNPGAPWAEAEMRASARRAQVARSGERATFDASGIADGTVRMFGRDLDLPVVIVGSIVAFIVVDRVVNR